MTFQTTVVTIAIIILILSLVVLGVVLYNSRNKDQFPPEISNCPDYFTMKEKGGGDSGTPIEMCYNQHLLGNHSDGCDWFDPKDATRKIKKEYTTKCGLTWDGITN